MADRAEIERRLRAGFDDTLDRANSKAAIFVSFTEGEVRRFVVGIPYTIADGKLVVGPYAKDPLSPIPKDYERRKIPIDLVSIISAGRVELVGHGRVNLIIQ